MSRRMNNKIYNKSQKEFLTIGLITFITGVLGCILYTQSNDSIIKVLFSICITIVGIRWVTTAIPLSINKYNK